MTRTTFSAQAGEAVVRRRSIVLAATGGAVSALSRAQTMAKPAKVGWLAPGGTTPEDQTRHEQRIEKRFRELGWETGKNLRLENRFFRSDPALLTKMAAEMVAMNCDVIMAAENYSLGALLQAGAKAPIVVQVGNNLAELKLVDSYAKPGGKITGLVADQSEQISAKPYELLKAMIPSLRRVGNLSALNVQGHGRYDPAAEQAVAQLGLAYTQVAVEVPEEIEPAFGKLAAARVEAVVVGASTISYTHMQRFIELAGRYKLPDFTYFKLATESGALASFGADFEDLILRSIDYVDKILRGANPAELPIQMPTKYEFVVNLKRARQLGLKIPNSALVRADKVLD